MNIELQYGVLSVDDVDAWRRYRLDGLSPVGDGSHAEVLDGTAVISLSKNDPASPPAMGTPSTLCESVLDRQQAPGLPRRV
jgi:hypothetical protein